MNITEIGANPSADDISLFEKLETFNNLRKKHLKYIDCLKTSHFSQCQKEAEQLNVHMERFYHSLHGTLKVDLQTLLMRFTSASETGDVKAIDLLFTELKTQVVANPPKKEKDSFTHFKKSFNTPKWSPFGDSSHFLYRYLDLLAINPNDELKLITFPLLHAAALTKRQEELKLCLNFITANEKLRSMLFTTGDCCFIFTDGTKLFFYRAVLAKLLPHFQILLTGNMLEASAKEICMNEASDPTIMKEILSMLYGYNESFQSENLLLYLQEAAYMNAPSLTQHILKCYYEELDGDYEIDAELLITLFTFAKEQKIPSLSTFVVYWTVYKLVHGKAIEGEVASLLQLLGDNVTHIGNEQYEAMNNHLPSWLNFQTRKITDKQLIPLFKAFPKATSWNLRRYDNITDNAVEYLTTYCKGIRKLEFYCSDHLTDVSLILIADNLPHLEILRLDTFERKSSLFTDEGLIYLLSSCKNMTQIELSHIQKVTLFTRWFYHAASQLSLKLEHFQNPDRFYSISPFSMYAPSIKEIIALLKVSPNLKNIDITMGGKDQEEPHDSQQLIQTVIHSCKFIERLELDTISKPLTIAQEDLQSLLNMPHLKHLTIKLAKRDFDPFLLKKDPRLKSLFIRYEDFAVPYYSYNKKEK